MVIFTGASVEEAIQNGLKNVGYSTYESAYHCYFT